MLVMAAVPTVVVKARRGVRGNGPGGYSHFGAEGRNGNARQIAQHPARMSESNFSRAREFSDRSASRRVYLPANLAANLS